MLNAIETALTGLNKASSQINESAKRIASSTAQTPVMQSTPPVSLPENTSQNALIAQEQGTSLVSDIVNLKIASLSYQANLKTIETVNNLYDTLLETFDD